tara:strand:- start:7984 stop:8991 length:1008 start_codon:yes stop_codon:yes gene_type:complete
MSLLLNGDCLELMKDLDDESVDLIFCDLPYVDSKGKGQTSCHWNQSAIDLEKFWIQVMRIKKLNTPIFMTTTTKFGVELINTAPKKLKFFDLVWVKSAPTGFLLAKKFPLRKHEMIYVFYEKLPFYDLSSHQHKFLKPNTPMTEKPDMYGRLWDKDGKPYVKEKQHSQYSPPLPVSIVKEVIRTDEGCNALYGKETGKVFIYDEKGKLRNSEPRYDPPLPVSIVKEETGGATGKEDKHTLYGEIKELGIPHTSTYDPPLPNSMLEIKSTRGKHSTEKPVALMEWVLKYYSKEGDVVLDPTMGSGSTGIACKNMNRNFIGMEMDDEIYDFAVNRIN